mmetsp:Transcript_5085/g.10758  ORF Transcript_5085/g.10758 Transcript_5085/m.10758 type:complete len:84 (-) Transcript_5085:76-327(-)
MIRVSPTTSSPCREPGGGEMGTWLVSRPAVLGAGSPPPSSQPPTAHNTSSTHKPAQAKPATRHHARGEFRTALPTRPLWLSRA